jgi:hypothetical protein
VRDAKLTMEMNLQLVSVQQPKSFLKMYINLLRVVSTLMNCKIVMKDYCTKTAFKQIAGS